MQHGRAELLWSSFMCVCRAHTVVVTKWSQNCCSVVYFYGLRVCAVQVFLFFYFSRHARQTRKCLVCAEFGEALVRMTSVTIFFVSFRFVVCFDIRSGKPNIQPILV